MDNRNINVPDQKNFEKAYQLAYKLVGEKLSGLSDITEQCRKAGAGYRENGADKAITLPFLNILHEISLPDIDITLADSKEEVPIREKLLILHYFTAARGTPLSGKPVTYQELPEGVVYYPTFSQRTIIPLTRFFGETPEKLLEVSRDFGGEQVDFGDVGVKVPAFPFVPITIVFWKGDDELPPQGNILFDSTITDYLSTEDITVLCETLTWRLVRKLS